MPNIQKFDDSMSLPAHLQKQFGGPENSDLSGGVSMGFPIISYKGKTWSLHVGKQSEVILRPGSEDEPASFLELVIVKANPALSKVYYPGGYTEGSDEKPMCFSNDGMVPDAGATSPQSSSCATCPHNAWGSRITENGSKGKACSDSRRLAVVPNGDLSRPMLLRVPAATLKDLSHYADMLSKRNAPYQAVVTKVSFDPTVAHPKLVFKAVRWLDEDEAKEVAELMQSEVVAQIVGNSTPRAQVQLPPAEDDPTSALDAKPAVTKAAPKTAAKPKPAPVEDAEVVDPPKKASGFGTKASAPKTAPEPSKSAKMMIEASSELDAALAELDDLD